MISAAVAILETDAQRNELSEFYERNTDRFLNVALKTLHNKEQAEDAVQEAFLRIANSPDVFFSLGNKDRIRYMCAVVRNIAVDMYKKSRTLGTEELSEDIAYRNDDAPIENSLLADIAREEILAFIDTLPEAQRAVLVLSYASGLSADEIAAALNIPVSAVYKRLYAARKSVRRFIEERSER